MKALQRFLFALALALPLAAAAGCPVGLEDGLIFFPAKYPEGDWDLERLSRLPGGENPAIEDAFFETSDGVKLHGWYCSPRSAAASGQVVLWFHGNAGNLSDRYDMIRGFTALAVSVFIIDYRGYGRSEGTPSEKGIYLDAQAAWRYLTESREIPPGRIVLLGKSLGGAAAADLASKVQPSGVILQSTFTSVPDMAQVVFPFLPRFLIRTKMDNLSKIARVGAPKLFIHSPGDEVVPFRLGRRLYEAAPAPKRFYEVPGARHNDTYWAGGPAYWRAIGDFLASLRPVPTPAPGP